MEVESAVSDAIDALVRTRSDPGGPGVAVAVIRGGAIEHARGYGLANLEWDLPVATDTVFGLGSLTKPFTATAILLLEGEGTLRLEDSIRRYLAELPAPYQPITLTHLLTHTAGVPNYVTRPGFWEEIAHRDYAPADLPALFTDLPLDFAPGTDYSYSNSAYALLGLLIERMSGQSYADFIQRRIFEPLAMSRSGYLWHDPILPRRAGGYAKTADGYQNARYISPTLLSAGGGLGATFDDLVRWDRALREHRLLDAATQARMQTPARLANGQTRGYGLGWGLSTYRR